MTTKPPPPPSRTTASLPSRVTFEGAQTWRESFAAFIAILLLGAAALSTIILLYYAWKNDAIYEELVDYFDKTISISKINYNPMRGLYQLLKREHALLEELGTNSTLLWCYLAAEFGGLILLVIVILIYFVVNLTSRPMKVIFWVLFFAACLYFIVMEHVFLFMLKPYASTMPSGVEKLLDHAIPHNPGGLQQMESRLGCTFDYNLYQTASRRSNPKNTCDPSIEGSFVPFPVLCFLLAIHLLPLIGIALLAKHTPIGELIAVVIEKIKPSRKERLYTKRTQPYQEKKSTTFGVHNPRIPSTPLPPIPSPSVDHSISYNNAAFFATSGAVGSSRSSEISRIDAHDLMRNPASGSIQSVV